MVGKYFKITGDGAVHSFSSALTAFLATNEPGGGFSAKWFQVYPDPANSAVQALVGGPEVTTTVGFPIPAGGVQFFPDISEMAERYRLAQQFYFLGAGDVMHCLYGVD